MEISSLKNLSSLMKKKNGMPLPKKTTMRLLPSLRKVEEQTWGGLQELIVFIVIEFLF